jgi:hypothetical protein
MQEKSVKLVKELFIGFKENLSSSQTAAGNLVAYQHRGDNEEKRRRQQVAA